MDEVTWDAILAESELQRASTPISRMSSRPLPLRGRLVIHLPEVSRQVDAITPTLRDALGLLVRGDAPWPLFVHGAVGTGKSCAALCLLDHTSGHYHTALGLAELLARSQQGRYTETELSSRETRVIWPELVWSWLSGTPLVVLDELGSRGHVTDHQYETVKRLIDCRHGKPLVCLSNLCLEELASLYDARVADRLAAGTKVHLTGPSRRLQGGRP